MPDNGLHSVSLDRSRGKLELKLVDVVQDDRYPATDDHPPQPSLWAMGTPLSRESYGLGAARPYKTTHFSAVEQEYTASASGGHEDFDSKG
jgi:hypothetical protein